MANQGAKKRKEENARHMAKLLRLIIACNYEVASFVNNRLELPPFEDGLGGTHIGSKCIEAASIKVIYILVRMLVFYSTVTWKHWIGFIVTSLAYVIPYQQLAKMAQPSYADDGELLDGGFDMSTGGVCGYLHDVIYITSFVQLTSIISGKFWYTYLLIPAFAGYKLFGVTRGFMSQGSEGTMEDEKSRKKREKLEKKASRGKFVKARSK